MLVVVELAQLVRALDCGSRGRGFDSRIPPHLKKEDTFICIFSFFVKLFIHSHIIYS